MQRGGRECEKGNDNQAVAVHWDGKTKAGQINEKEISRFRRELMSSHYWGPRLVTPRGSCSHPVFSFYSGEICGIGNAD